ILGHIVDTYRAAGIREAIVVRGYRKDQINLPGLIYANNEQHDSTGELVSLSEGLKATDDNSQALVVSYGDVLFNRYILQILEVEGEDFVIAVDTDWQDSVNKNRAADYVSCSEPYSRSAFYHRVLLKEIGEDLAPQGVDGEWMGFLRVAATAMPRFRQAVSAMIAAPGNEQAKLHHLLTQLLRQGESIRVVYTSGHWLDVDTLDDVISAGKFA
ncbi:MAG: phosphoenolpyruvate mutase, partial [Gammaproteobacteria bacterium]